MFLSLRWLISVFSLVFLTFPVVAENTKPTENAKSVESTNKKGSTAVSTPGEFKTAKLTEEQAVNQLKYMMVKGFSRVEKELIANGSFAPFGLSLLPDGEFKAVFIESDEKIPTQVQLIKVVESMETIAKTRTMWAVGIMYIRAVKRDDGTYAQRIIVMAEHIAGWARSWAYPFKIENGEVKLAMPNETALDPIYYVEKN